MSGYLLVSSLILRREQGRGRDDLAPAEGVIVAVLIMLLVMLLIGVSGMIVMLARRGYLWPG
jgi:hypothetical protein